MEERTIEVTVVSASDLKYVKSFGQQECYVVAYIFPEQKKTTKVDNKGGLNPFWNSKLTFTCDERILERGGSYLTLEIYSLGTLQNKLVGTVTIPLPSKDSKNDASAKEYSVRRPSGKSKGHLKVLVKLGEKHTTQSYGGSQGYSYSQDYKKESRPTYPPATYGVAPTGYTPQKQQSASPYYVGGTTAGYGGTAAAVPYTATNLSSSKADGISPYSSSNNQSAAYPPQSGSNPAPTLTGYSASDSTGVNAVPPVYPNAVGAGSSSSSSSEPAIAYPAMGYPVNQGYPPAPSQYPQQYPPPQYYTQQTPYYPPQPQPYYQKPHRSGGAGFGTGLLGGALGGLLLGDMLDFDC